MSAEEMSQRGASEMSTLLGVPQSQRVERRASEMSTLLGGRVSFMSAEEMSQRGASEMLGVPQSQRDEHFARRR